MPGTLHRRAALAAVLVALAAAWACLGAAGAAAGVLEPQGKQVYFGVSDTGNPASFGEFSTAVSKHPAVIESFRAWGSDFHDSIQRWEIARARPMIHITTADPQTGAEMISLAAIASGAGDGYLIRLNHLFAEKHMRAYVRPLGEPNRCLNVYAAYECAGHPREAEDSARNYRRAFRRIYVIVHGGGKAKLINERLAEAGLPPLNATVGGLPKAPVAIVWSPLPSGSPTTKKNLPQHLLPGGEMGRLDRHRLLRLLSRMGRADAALRTLSGKAVRDHRVGRRSRRRPELRRHLFAWVKTHPRTKMLVYYQDFGSTSNYRIQNYAESLSVLTAQLHSGNFPAYAPGAPHLPPPPPGGLEPGR